VLNEYERGGTQKDEYAPEDVLAVPCPLCGSERATPLASEYGSIGIKRCAECHLIYTSPRVRQPETVYWGDYEDYLTEARLIFSGQAAHHRDPNYLEELELIESRRPARGRFLDVGCNMGMLLRLARQRGWDTVGVEPSPALHRIATEQLGLEVHNCLLEELPSELGGSFDVVALSDVFEHITNPVEFLRLAARFLRPEGLLYVKVPNARWSLLKQAMAKRLGRQLARGVWDSYEHVVHYTEPTLRAMLRTGGYDPLLVTSGRPIQIPVWHEYVGRYYLYPSPWVLDWRRHLGRRAFHLAGQLERRVRGGEVGYCSSNLVALARVTPGSSARPMAPSSSR
jgi:2-polyprenyl-3-methyl-5-hydroxy-6-metoxy-1,4-benzoquinol methylase